MMPEQSICHKNVIISHWEQKTLTSRTYDFFDRKRMEEKYFRTRCKSKANDDAPDAQNASHTDVESESERKMTCSNENGVLYEWLAFEVEHDSILVKTVNKKRKKMLQTSFFSKFMNKVWRWDGLWKSVRMLREPRSTKFVCDVRGVTYVWNSSSCAHVIDIISL